MKAFKYQITVKVLLSKHREKGGIEFAPVCLNFTSKTVINLDYDLSKSFPELLCMINDWINEEPGWAIESADGELVNIPIFSPLSGSPYIELSGRLRKSMGGLIIIKNNDNKCFFRFLIRYLKH